MERVTESVIFYAELSPNGQAALRGVLERDPALREVFLTWRRMRSGLRAGLDRAVPDRHLLVLHALAEAGRTEGFTDAETAALQAAQPALREALAKHPALEAVLKRVREEQEAFERAWTEHVQDAGEKAVAVEEAVALPEPVGERRRLAAARPSRRPERQAVRPRVRRLGVWAWRVAAVLAVAAIVTVVSYVGREEPAPVVIRTAVGETQEVALPDGSRVRLLGDSELEYRSASRRQAFDRRVAFRGSAYFDVIADPEHPFSVETPEATATVLGTEFGIAAGNDRTEVVLATGRVALISHSEPDHRVTLEPRQKSHVQAGEVPARPVSVDLVDALDWTGLFVFRQEPYRQVARHLSRHFGVEVTVDPEIADEWVNGTFLHTDSLTFILDTITRDGRVQVVPSGERSLRLSVQL